MANVSESKNQSSPTTIANKVATKANTTNKATLKVKPGPTAAQIQEQAKRALVRKVVSEKLAMKAQEDQQIYGQASNQEAVISAPVEQVQPPV